jgi:hypothetical protein
MPASTTRFFNWRAKAQNAQLVMSRYESHDVFGARAIVPASMEDDDFAGRRKMGNIALWKQLALLTPVSLGRK